MRDELELLKETLKYKDVGWEARLKTALAVFMEGSELCKDGSVGISIVNGVLLPCLEIIQQQTSHSPESTGIRLGVAIIPLIIGVPGFSAIGNGIHFRNLGFGI